MTTRTTPADPRYTSLISPLQSITAFTEAEHETLLREESEILDGTSFKILGKAAYQRGTQLLKAGELQLIAGRTTPVQSSNSSPGFSCFFAMPFIGGFTTRDGSLYDEVSPGDIDLNQNYFGTSTIGYLSPLFVALDQQRLDRTMREISGCTSLTALGTSVVIQGKMHKASSVGADKIWQLISLIDTLNSEDAIIPSCLGLDEQFYRLLSLSLLETCGKFEGVKKR